MENAYTTNKKNNRPATLRNAKATLEMEVWKKLEGEDLWLGPKGVMVNSTALEGRKVFYNIVQVS
ncbi:MAG: hypothetical protein ACRCYY_12300 [Trueperaceae bacterium]